MFIFYSSGIKENNKRCKTISGPQKDKECIFPFACCAAKTQHNKCTTIGNNGVPWCSTKTDGNTNWHLSPNWGNCPEQCSAESNSGSTRFLSYVYKNI